MIKYNCLNKIAKCGLDNFDSNYQATDNVDDNTYIPNEYVTTTDRTVEDSINAILLNFKEKKSNNCSFT